MIWIVEKREIMDRHEQRRGTRRNCQRRSVNQIHRTCGPLDFGHPEVMPTLVEHEARQWQMPDLYFRPPRLGGRVSVRGRNSDHIYVGFGLKRKCDPQGCGCGSTGDAVPTLFERQSNAQSVLPR